MIEIIIVSYWTVYIQLDIVKASIEPYVPFLKFGFFKPEVSPIGETFLSTRFYILGDFITKYGFICQITRYIRCKL